METLLFYIAFELCFLCFAIRTPYHVLANRGSIFTENRRFITMLFVIMSILWFAWFFMSFNDPYRMNVPSRARYVGLAVFIAGFLLFILSHTVFRSLARAQETDKLIKTGIYSKNKKPDVSRFYNLDYWTSHIYEGNF